METKPLAEQLYEDAFRPLITWSSIHGNKAKLVAEYRTHDSSATRQTVESWLNPDSTRRRMPLYHRGLLLLECACRLKIYRELPPEETTNTNPKAKP